MLPAGGDFSFVTGPNPRVVYRNRDAWCRELGVSVDRLVCARQVHGTAVEVVSESHAGRGAASVETAIHGVDALVTDVADVPLAVLSADCAPILIFDPDRRVIAAVHAGWRGTVAGIAASAVATLADRYGSRPEELIVGVGPSICAACYQVGPEVIEAWEDSEHARESGAVARRPDGWYFDLVAANVATLVASGVSRTRIEIAGTCTKCSNGDYFSRRGLGPRTGLFASVIALSDEHSWSGGRNA
jgi:polyphenol oxidase